jgi:hypothetical protein
MSTETTPVTVTLTQGEWDTIRIAILTASGTAYQDGRIEWYKMLREAYSALKETTF